MHFILLLVFYPQLLSSRMLMVVSQWEQTLVETAMASKIF